jgi:hypothetical protein
MPIDLFRECGTDGLVTRTQKPLAELSWRQFPSDVIQIFEGLQGRCISEAGSRGTGLDGLKMSVSHKKGTAKIYLANSLTDQMLGDTHAL